VTPRDAVDGWVESLAKVQGKADGTIRRYRRRVEHMLADIPIDEPTHLTSAAIDKYLRRIYVADAAASTINGTIAAMRSYCGHLCMLGVLDDNPALKLTGPPVYSPEPPTLPVDQTRRLVYPRSLPSSPLDARAVVLVPVSYGVGLRVSEPGRLRLADLEWDPDRGIYSVLVRHAKWSNRDQRLWIYDRRISQLLGAWLPIRDEIGGPWLFPSSTSSARGICPKTAERDFRRRLTAVGISCRYTYHALRHSLATHLAARGVPLPVIKELLRHRSLRTTMRYIHVPRGELARVWRYRHPLERRSEPADIHRLARELHADIAGGRK